MEEKREQKIATPVTIIWEKILMLTIVGTVDSNRSQEIMETMLRKVTETRSKIIILDILGVGAIDSAVANHLIKITKATKLVGCDTIITGISPEIAQTIVSLGIELGDIVTTAALSDGLELAFKTLGLEVRKIK